VHSFTAGGIVRQGKVEMSYFCGPPPVRVLPFPPLRNS
jgi:hypothetical protein